MNSNGLVLDLISSQGNSRDDGISSSKRLLVRMSLLQMGLGSCSKEGRGRSCSLVMMERWRRCIWLMECKRWTRLVRLLRLFSLLVRSGRSLRRILVSDSYSEFFVPDHAPDFISYLEYISRNSDSFSRFSHRLLVRSRVNNLLWTRGSVSPPISRATF